MLGVLPTQAADIVALIRLTVTYLVSAREPALRLLACCVFLIPMPRLICSAPSHDDAERDREQAREAADLPHALEHQQQHEQQHKQQEQQPSGEPSQPHRQFRHGEDLTLVHPFGVGERSSQDSLHCSKEIKDKGLKIEGKSSSSSSSEPHTAVLVPPTQPQRVQQQQREKEEIVARDIVPITSTMVLGSAIMACSPGVLLAGQWDEAKQGTS